MIVSVSLFLSLFIGQGLADRVRDKIYIDLDTKSSCFRILNGTHQIGCQSSAKGNVGTIHYIQDESDYEWVLSKGPHDPYVILFDAADFTGPNVRRLYQSDRVNGILVINSLNESTPLPVDGFSSQEGCPNDRSGLYGEEDQYKHCQKMTWNPTGSGLGREDLSIPMFALSSQRDVDMVLYKCFYPFNHDAKTKGTGYPVCAAEMKGNMAAAVDSRTCIRRSNMFAFSLSPGVSQCDELGDSNVFATLKETDGLDTTREDDSVILVGTRADSTSLFDNEYKAAETTVSGLVTLLSVAETLWKVKGAIRNDDQSKDIMFAFFQGETFDYIGSSRTVYDMEEAGDFPPSTVSNAKAKKSHLAKIALKNLHQIIELNQVGRRDDEGSLYMHTDPIGLSKVLTQVNEMENMMTEAADQANVTVTKANPNIPLPPASAQSFLKKRLDIPTIVLTDHKEEFTNKYYNSRLDLNKFINADNYPSGSNATEKYNFVTKQAQMITELSSTVSRYLFKASTGKDPSGDVLTRLTADSATVTHLLYCFTISPNCELFKEVIDDLNANILASNNKPFPLYVSANTRTNEATVLINRLLDRFTGDEVDSCSRPDGDNLFSYTKMQGPVDSATGKRKGICMKSTAFTSWAMSPAFLIDDYDMTSGEYSTWTESMWRFLGVRIFLIPSPQLQLSVLLTGLAMIIVSLIVVYLIASRADLLFAPPDSLARPDYTDYNAMT